MGIFIFLLITFIVLLLILIYSIFNEYLTNKKQNERQDYFDTSLSLEELERHAKITACEQTSIKKHSGFFRWLLRGLKSNHRYIYFVYKNLNDNSKRLRGVSPAAEWLLDNYYIIEEQVKNIKKDLKRKNYSKLPTLKNSALAGYPRVYAIATQLVSHTDGKIEAKLIEEYLKAYQSVNVLTENELWAVSLMIRIALIENIRTACNKIEAARIQHEKVDIIFENVDINEAKELERLKYSINSYLKTLNQPDSSFIEHLAYRLRRVGKSSSVILRQIDFYLTRLGMDIETLTQQEHSIQALNKMRIENCILSLKYISSLDWIDVFENISHVEAILQKDPMGVYALMDMESKSLYRKKIEAFAKRFNASEVHVANCVYELAEENADTKTKHSHVGYYLIDRGNKKLEEIIALKHTESYGLLYMLIKRPKILYFGLIIFLISCLTVTLSLYTFYNTINHSIVLTIITAFIVLIPSSEASILLVNKIVGIIYKPAILPKLNFNESIPDDSSTMIVIPTLLSSKKRVDEMIKNLELHYLANKNENLYFSISGDFKDGNNEYEKSDNGIIETGLNSIEILNKKYSLIDKPIFYFFLRKREYNNKQGKWMGKERKRGALVEFNRLLKGDNDTTYIYNSCKINNIPKIKYVITLDADTMMNIDTAKKLIGAMAHPLNKPLVNEDKTAVIEGYCLMQPRINFDIESVNASLFSRIFSGGEGIDPYSGAVSDVYQDLFGEGIFTGKGIYELDTFKEITNDIIADNSILSHDLLEGSLVRTGLLTDVEFIDSYPSKYSSFAMRLHRWVRGDWQLLPWLKSTIINNKGEKVKNPLSFISKWKLIDNLRRSLLAPTLIIFNLLIFSVLPGNYWFWTIIFLAAALHHCLSIYLICLYLKTSSI
ncbi:MAG TPA: hypothetical protein VFD03_09310 [Clostridia bacterium]|nr:hypothetical protein [Clostridia bacterium]